VNPTHQAPAYEQFTVDELLVVIETLEAAMQAEGFVDTTSSGAATPADKDAILADIACVWQKARELRRQMIADHPTAHRWHVWPIDQDGNEIASVSEFRAATATGALAHTAGMAVTECADFAGWKVVRARTHIDAADEAGPCA
jgi:hypothetical protein